MDRDGFISNGELFLVLKVSHLSVLSRVCIVYVSNPTVLHDPAGNGRFELEGSTITANRRQE